MTPLLRRQLVVVPLSVLLGFLLASVGFRNGLDETVFGNPYDTGGGYNALGRIRPLNDTVRPVAIDGEHRQKEVVPDGLKIKDLAMAVDNRTLGFGKLFVVNLPQNTDRRDTMVLASSFSRVNVDWVNGLPDDQAINETPLRRQDQEKESTQLRENWRAHVNAVRTTVELDLFSAIVLEDNLDWDIRLREQMHAFALSTRTLTQPLALTNSTKPIYADASFPDPSLSNKVTEIPFAGHPATIQPSNSAYGDDWDVLWLGHCGMQMPTQRTPDLSKGRVVLTPDPFVAVKDTISIDGSQNDSYPNQTRVFHHTYAPECSLAYAVSQRGARRILYEALERNATEGFDVMLREMCDAAPDSAAKLVCVTTQPSLFSRWRDGGSQHVRWSVRMNMGKYVRGNEREWVDQYPE
ncbi:glycosyltransferase family 25 protein [Karstenula rhodostoma CBS 690.94]|uniref:Glycosyltransferase family 25 protein n=1 Tax=Karstenula rhodostoma CBS 690.94 TaxID=1392251 RepID=A0A9P4PTW3_9PLEO|nr:glycosyltransferase family 25 protein [Karstenula rhodostoma CBS 690.94]